MDEIIPLKALGILTINRRRGVVWCDVVWCDGVVWCGVVWCGVVWCGVVSFPPPKLR